MIDQTGQRVLVIFGICLHFPLEETVLTELIRLTYYNHNFQNVKVYMNGY